MELQGERVIPAPIEATWAALNDPEVLKACIAGCESIERTGEQTLTAVVALRVGPVSARFKGRIEMTNVDAPNGCTIHFDGQGGVAGFGKGSADVALAAQGSAQTLLNYTARATVGGKMAQIGSRLIDATAAKITGDFFAAFEARWQPAAAMPVDAAVAAVAPSIMMAPEAAAPTPLAGAPAPVALASPPAADADAGVAKLWWLIGAVVLLAIVYFLIR